MCPCNHSDSSLVTEFGDFQWRVRRSRRNGRAAEGARDQSRERDTDVVRRRQSGACEFTSGAKIEVRSGTNGCAVELGHAGTIFDDGFEAATP
jgi:hypothetical protein